jgi:hypothetical protein
LCSGAVCKRDPISSDRCPTAEVAAQRRGPGSTVPRRLERLIPVDAHQAALDARVAEAAEAWLTAPADVAAYGRLVAAVEQRRRWLDRSGRAGPADKAAVLSDPDHPGEQLGESTKCAGEDLGESTNCVDEPATCADEAFDDELDRSWPTVRAVGADLAGDPVAVLRRLRGG